MAVLHCVQALSSGHVESVDACEVSLFSVVKECVVLCDAECVLSLPNSERTLCWLCLSVLGCRNGVELFMSLGASDVTTPNPQKTPI